MKRALHLRYRLPFSLNSLGSRLHNCSAWLISCEGWVSMGRTFPQIRRTGRNLNEQQNDAAQYEGGHILALAGAGTGKTRTIIARAAHLLQSGCEAVRIFLFT